MRGFDIPREEYESGEDAFLRRMEKSMSDECTNLIGLDPLRVARDFLRGYVAEPDLYLHPPQAKWLVKLIDEAIDAFIAADLKRGRQP